MSSDPPSPESAQEALQRAGRHARRAFAEALAALQALLDAAAISTLGEPASAHAALAPLASLLRDLARGLAPHGNGKDTELLASVVAALGAEIARWETRAQEDPDARIVLRTLLGLREILWELGVRPKASAGAPRARPARPKPGPRRVQRVKVK